VEAAWRQVTQIASPDLPHDLRKFELSASTARLDSIFATLIRNPNDRSSTCSVRLSAHAFDTRFRELKIVLDSSRSRHLPWMCAVRNIRTVRILLGSYFSKRLRESRSTTYRESKTRHGACHLARNFVLAAQWCSKPHVHWIAFEFYGHNTVIHLRVLRHLRILHNATLHSIYRLIAIVSIRYMNIRVFKRRIPTRMKERRTEARN